MPAALVFLGAAFALPGCGGRDAGGMRLILPATAYEWSLDGVVEYVSPDALFDHINGGAEVYLEKGFRELAVGHYVLTGGTETMAEVYTMESPSAAAEMFALEQGTGETGAMGEEASVGSQSVAFRRGPHYVKLIAYTPEEGLQAKLEQLASAIDARLTGG
jgi:hypothetical protein